VTLGDPDLDGWVHGPEVLAAGDHDAATFELSRFASDGPALAWGSLAPVVARGRFTMRGVTVDLDVRTQLEPVMDEAGQARLLAAGTFTIPLARVWEISVPVGDPPENETLVFDFDFTLAPADRPSR